MSGQLPEAKLYATSKEVTAAWVEWSKMRVCSKCGQAFNWLGSLGAWECSQHLGPISCRVKKDKYGISKRVYKYYDCCQARPNTAYRQHNENIWGIVRSTRPCVDMFPIEQPVKGCIPCDHTEATHILDDGIRLGVPIESPNSEHAFAPKGGFKINDTIIYQGKERVIAQIYFDKTVDLEDVDQGRISARFLNWQNIKYKLKEGGYYEFNSKTESVPVKILKMYMDKHNKILVDYKIMNLGMAVHSIAAMIPHMGPNPEKRPGWQFPKDKDGKIIYPHIRNVADRTKYIKTDLDI